MIKIGSYNELMIVKRVAFGFYLDGGAEGEILLPSRDIAKEMKVGDTISVFLYFDSKDRLIATTKKAKAEVEKFTSLKVIDTNQAGAFLDWGLAKDLLVPFNQQKTPMKLGFGYVVYVYQDKVSGRLAASSKLDRFLDNETPTYQVGDKVNLLIADKTELGFKAIINDKHWGVLFENEVFSDLGIGKKIKGYIKQVRADGKLDLSLTKAGYAKVDALAQRVLQTLHLHQGVLAISDKSPPAQIANILKMSKGNFKKAIGQLYKKGLIVIENKGIRLVE
ncbi:MAG: GntR family transcriptional regulator [Psychromonas sp.]|nr:GntR family transcriptional regulator [Psychromonas sp.]